MIQLSDPAPSLIPVVFSGIAVSGIQLFLFGAKVVLISVAAALPALWLRMMPNPSYCTSQDMPQMHDL